MYWAWERGDAFGKTPCVPSSYTCGLYVCISPSGEHVEVRSAALHLLVSFVGAQLSSLYAVQDFVQHAHACYRCPAPGPSLVVPVADSRPL